MVSLEYFGMIFVTGNSTSENLFKKTESVNDNNNH